MKNINIAGIIFILFSLPISIRAALVDRIIFNFTGKYFFGAFQVVTHDAIVYLAILILLYLSLRDYKHKIYKAIPITFSLSLLAVYSLDVIIMYNFNTRLVLNDVVKYYSYSISYINQISSKIICIAIISIFLILLTIFISFYKSIILYKNENFSVKKINIVFIPILSIFLFMALSKNDNAYTHSWMYNNIFEHNMMIISESSKYSNKFIDKMHYTDTTHCENYIPVTKNIIIIMVESLSVHQSNLFSGILDFTPNIDNIARKNIYFPNFYANGFNTEDGEISILTGKLPFYPPSSYKNGGGIAFKGFYNDPNSLPIVLKKNGYETEFLTTEDLEFQNTRTWLKSIGFDHIEGHENEYYNNWPKFHFMAAPDEALFNRALYRIKEKNKEKKKSFFFIKTTTSHHPFLNPENNIKSEKEVFMYTDKQIGIFYDKLLEDNFFDEGMLIIVGDHHAMIPIKKEEIVKYGHFRASAAVPLILIDGINKNKIVNDNYQQIDIYNSLKNMVSGKICTSEWVGNFIGDVLKPAKYIAHKRGDNRDTISIFLKESDLLVKLDGDRTRIIINRQPNSVDEKSIVDKINFIRSEGVK